MSESPNLSPVTDREPVPTDIPSNVSTTSTTDEETMSWAEISDVEPRKATEEPNIHTLEERVQELEQRAKYFEEALKELNSLHSAEFLQHLEKQMKRLLKENSIMAEESYARREPVLNSWCGIRPSSMVDRRINLHNNRGDIRADIRAIIIKENIDSEVSERWKGAFVDRYGITWKECRERDHLQDVSLEGIQLFNMRAYASHRFQENREDILDICDDWIDRWREDDSLRDLDPDLYRTLCDLYYTS